MNDPHLEIAVRLGAAWLAGSLIGLERTLHGRPAGFRTFGLITVSSALLMLFTFSQAQLIGLPPADALPIDPRMAQGIMTGIGFIGAGVVFKEGMTVHGLTSAASVWVAAALGIIIGSGFWWPALLALVIILITLTLKKFEDRLPRFHVTFVRLCYERQSAPRAEEVRDLLRGAGFTLKEMSYRLDPREQVMEYRVAIRTRRATAVEQLAIRFCQMPEVRGFEFSPTDE